MPKIKENRKPKTQRSQSQRATLYCVHCKQSLCCDPPRQPDNMSQSDESHSSYVHDVAPAALRKETQCIADLRDSDFLNKYFVIMSARRSFPGPFRSATLILRILPSPVPWQTPITRCYQPAHCAIQGSRGCQGGRHSLILSPWKTRPRECQATTFCEVQRLYAVVPDPDSTSTLRARSVTFSSCPNTPAHQLLPTLGDLRSRTCSVSRGFPALSSLNSAP